jgi:O-antigen ligase
MGKVIVMGLIAIVSLFSFAFPWLGAVAGYTFTALAPQDIWYWDFTGFRPEFWMLGATGIGFIIGVVTHRINLETIKNRRNLFLFILLIGCIVSYYFGPFTHVGGPYRFTNSTYRLDNLYKIFILFLIASACIDRESRLKVLYGVLVFSGIYMTYWAHHQYAIGHYDGRLNGPAAADGAGMYVDQNSFAMLFVVLSPFIWYWGAIQRSAWKWVIWLIIPFCWRAIFLTASRGGLLGLGITLVVIVLRANRRILGLLLLPAFLFVFFVHGGAIMLRRADRITNYHQQGSAADRLESWRAALRMIAAHPVTGVGLASYGPAFPHFSNKQPREAHDTFLQIAADNGLITGVMYLLVVIGSLTALWKNGIRLKKRDPEFIHSFLYAANEATLAAFSGLAVCSIFLSLQDFEIFYCLVVMTNAVLFLSQKSLGSAVHPVVAEDAATPTARA